MRTALSTTVNEILLNIEAIKSHMAKIEELLPDIDDQEVPSYIQCSLACNSDIVTGTKPVRATIGNATELSCYGWSSLFRAALDYLYDIDSTSLLAVAARRETRNFMDTKNGMRKPYKVAPKCYAELNMSAQSIFELLKYIFESLNYDVSSIVLYLEDTEHDDSK